MQTKEQVYQNCTIEGNIIKLPAQLDRKLYQEVAKGLELIGGKWNKKVVGFSFQEDPTELLEQLASGQKRDLKKEYQFFATPDTLADYLVEKANIQWSDTFLEPSAGQGAIVKAINRILPENIVDCFELMPINQTFLKKIATVNFLGADFLEADSDKSKYSKIIANPPFSKNQDIDHVRKMYGMLESGGRLVSITSTHWQKSSNRKEMNFTQWLDEVGAEIETVPAGTFKESGTGIETVIITIEKAGSPMFRILRDRLKQDAKKALELTETKNSFNPQFKSVAHPDPDLYDFDITDCADIRRAVYPEGIEIGETFNLYLDKGVKEGCVWEGSLKKSLLTFMETYKEKPYRFEYIVELLSLTKSDLEKYWSTQGGIINLTYLSEHIEEYENTRLNGTPRAFNLVRQEFGDVVDIWVKKGWGRESGVADIHHFTLTK